LLIFSSAEKLTLIKRTAQKTESMDCLQKHFKDIYLAIVQPLKSRSFIEALA
jgi:hypothetical protein